MADDQTAPSASSLEHRLLNPAVIVGGLGYLVDAYDLLLFNVTRVPALSSFGLEGDALTDASLHILNMQMIGLLVGGFMWGMLADRIGRKECLLASILIYSLATLSTPFLPTIDSFAFVRFLCGLGLAGEVGMGATLIVETMTARNRGLGVMLFVALAFIGIITAAVIATFLDWKICYLIGGGAGLILLALRSSLKESHIYKACAETDAMRGDLRLFLHRPDLLVKFIKCVILGLPIYFTIALLLTLAPEIGKAQGAMFAVTASVAIGLGYTGGLFGDCGAALLSQKLKARKPVMNLYMALGGASVVWYLLAGTSSPVMFYISVAVLGCFSIGYWVNMMMLATEHFGTNIRCTVSSSIPNLVRATPLAMNAFLAATKGEIGLLASLGCIGAIVYALAFWAANTLPETFGRDLDYTDAHK